jgi:hypothetical protein
MHAQESDNAAVRGLQSEFERVFGQPPSRQRLMEAAAVAIFESPLGPIVAAATPQAVCHISFSDERELSALAADIHRQTELPVEPGDRDSRTRSSSFFQTGRELSWEI